jgi:hydroxymethylbilane synthase
MKSKVVRIGTRGSELALWQAQWVQRELCERFKRLKVTIEIIKTKGDKVLDSPLSKIGGKGLFTKEIEHALLAEQIDLAVHSLKDLPTELPQGLTIAAICEREDVRDVFIPHPENPEKRLLQQPEGAKVVTGSLRRRCQLLNRRPDFQIIGVRGNLTTRLKKLDESDWVGIVLARAGMVRLGRTDRIGETIDADVVLPAVGQGAVAIEIRSGDTRIETLVSELHHWNTAQAALAERALLRRLEGGCQVPIGTLGTVVNNERGEQELVLSAMVGSLDGKTIIRGRTHGSPVDAESLGEELAETLLRGGAENILRSIRAREPKQISEQVEV